MSKKTIKKLIKNNKSPPSKVFEKLLSRQTKIILGAVDERLTKTDERIAIVEQRLVRTDERITLLNQRLTKLEERIMIIDQRIAKAEERFARKLDDLMTMLDKFLKRLLDAEDEFTAMKIDINRIKKVIREKLKVELL